VDFNITDIGELSGIQMGARQVKELLLGCKDLAYNIPNKTAQF